MTIPGHDGPVCSDCLWSASLCSLFTSTEREEYHSLTHQSRNVYDLQVSLRTTALARRLSTEKTLAQRPRARGSLFDSLMKEGS